MLFDVPYPLPRLIDCWSLHLFVMEDTGDIVGAFALNGKLKDAPHCRRFLVNKLVVFVRQVFHIIIDGAVCGRLAGLTLDANGSVLLATQVP